MSVVGRSDSTLAPKWRDTPIAPDPLTLDDPRLRARSGRGDRPPAKICSLQVESCASASPPARSTCSRPWLEHQPQGGSRRKPDDFRLSVNRNRPWRAMGPCSGQMLRVAWWAPEPVTLGDPQHAARWAGSIPPGPGPVHSRWKVAPLAPRRPVGPRYAPLSGRRQTNSKNDTARTT